MREAVAKFIDAKVNPRLLKRPELIDKLHELKEALAQETGGFEFNPYNITLEGLLLSEPKINPTSLARIRIHGFYYPVTNIQSAEMKVHFMTMLEEIIFSLKEGLDESQSNQLNYFEVKGFIKALMDKYPHIPFDQFLQNEGIWLMLNEIFYPEKTKEPDLSASVDMLIRYFSRKLNEQPGA